MKFPYSLAAAVAAAILAASPAHALPVSEQGRSCHLPGAEEALRCISVSVPLDYQHPGAGALALHVTLAPAFREMAKPDPLFVLAGGPGQAGSDVLAALNLMFRKARATRDIVLIDQRGTGLSGKLDCPGKADADAMSDAQAEAELASCLRAVKAPLAAYTTASAARDIEKVRLALGYAKVNVWGASYGTRLAQAYARAYPASVRSLVLDAVAAPDQIIPAGGRDAQAALETLFAQCARDAGCKGAFPALRSEFSALSERVAGGKVMLDMRDPRTAAPLHMPLTSKSFLAAVHAILYSPGDTRLLPFLIHSAYQGHWEPLVARSRTAGDVASESSMSIVLHLAVTCAEDHPRLSAQALAEDSRDSFMTAAQIERLSGMCAVIKVPPVPYQSPASIGAPALLLSGALDPVTPPRRAAAAARFMTHAQQVVVENAGHGVSALGCAPRLLREFLDKPDQNVDAKCLSEIPAPSFQLGSAGPQP
ncbi:MAG: alpha/beta hydrolase [Pseudomonadota bacterium]